MFHGMGNVSEYLWNRTRPLGEIDLVALTGAAYPCPIPNTPAYTSWLEGLRQIQAEMDAFTSGQTENRRTRKYYFMRAEFAKQLAREPYGPCRIAAQKVGRNISDFQAINELRKPWITLANDWTKRATKEERNEQIKLAAIAATIATAGAAALAAAGAAGGVTTAAGIQAAGSSLIGAAPGATLKEIGTVALKKYAIKYGTEEAVKYAAGEYAKHQQKKMTKAQEKSLAAELDAANKEYAELVARGTPMNSAAEVASRKPSSSGIIPLGLLFTALKYALA